MEQGPYLHNNNAMLLSAFTKDNRNGAITGKAICFFRSSILSYLAEPGQDLHLQPPDLNRSNACLRHPFRNPGLKTGATTCKRICFCWVRSNAYTRHPVKILRAKSTTGNEAFGWRLTRHYGILF